MRLRVTLTKADIARANILLIARSPNSLKGLGILVIGVSALISLTRGPDSDMNLLVLVVGSSIGGLAAFLVVCSASLVWTLWNSTDEAGVTGAHCFEITDQGLRDKSTLSDSLHLWKGTWKPLRSRQLMLVRTSHHLTHVLPRRAFQDDTEYAQWWSELVRRCNSI